MYQTQIGIATVEEHLHRHALRTRRAQQLQSTSPAASQGIHGGVEDDGPRMGDLTQMVIISYIS